MTTGGTGLAARDVTPEATRMVCDRIIDGLAERMRAEGLRETPLAALSRGICGTIGSALVVNLPGSPAGATTSLGRSWGCCRMRSICWPGGRRTDNSYPDTVESNGCENSPDRSCCTKSTLF